MSPENRWKSLLELELNQKRVEATLRATTWKELRSIGRAFKSNIGDAHSLLGLPHYFLIWAHQESEHLLAYVDISLPLAIRGHRLTDPSTRARINSELAQRLRNPKEKGKFIKKMAQWSTGAVEQVLAVETVQNMMTRVFYSVLTSLWTSFEVFAAETWKLFVNKHPEVLTRARMQEAFRESSTEGLSARSISVGILSQHGFDLRNCMGDLLATRINFSDLQQIKKSYSDVFEDAQCATLLDDAGLRLLEGLRHIILHRAAIVDERFNRTTNLNLPIGKPIEIHDLPAQSIAESMVNSACSLMLYVDKQHRNWSASEPGSGRRLSSQVPTIIKATQR